MAENYPGFYYGDDPLLAALALGDIDYCNYLYYGPPTDTQYEPRDVEELGHTEQSAQKRIKEIRTNRCNLCPRYKGNIPLTKTFKTVPIFAKCAGAQLCKLDSGMFFPYNLNLNDNISVGRASELEDNPNERPSFFGAYGYSENEPITIRRYPKDKFCLTRVPLTKATEE